MTAVVSAGEAVAVIKRVYEGDSGFDFVAMRCELGQWDKGSNGGNDEFIAAVSRAEVSGRTTVEIESTADAEHNMFSRKVAGRRRLE